MRKTMHAVLVLEDGTKFEGFSYGAKKSCAGEVVFNTAMTAYPESLTDPSCLGQILVSTYPIVGNCGVPSHSAIDSMSELLESEKFYPEAIISQDYSWEYSHWNAASSLAQKLIDEDVVGIYGIDTRALTKLLREKGSMLGKIIVDNSPDIDFFNPNAVNLVSQASCTQVKEYGVGNLKRVVFIDCGERNTIIRHLVERGAHVIRVPWNYDFSTLDYDGLFISNGPGNPDFAEETVNNIGKALQEDRPICGICMGNQLLGKAAGARVYKLKYGHHSNNQPVRELGTNRCFITSQNHGYAIDVSTLNKEWEPMFVNMNDGTNEGIRHKTKPFFSTQFHPEACAEPTDTEFVLDMFMNSIKK